LDLQDLFSPGGCAHILVTTRNPDFRQAGSLGSLELKGLQEDEAIQLLLTKADIQKPWDSSTIKVGKTIAKTLGYLALALIHAGNCIYRRICELGDYLNLHSASRSMLGRRKSSTSQEPEEVNIVRTVYSTFDVSLKFLLRTKSAKTQDASDLLKIISFYHFEHIPVEIFTRAVFNRIKATRPSSNDSFQSRMLKAITDRLEPPRMFPRFLKDRHDQLDKYRVTWAISELQSLSLISYDGRNRTFSMHPLVHAWARDSLSVSERKVWASIAFTTVMESILLPPEGNPETDGDFYREIIPHLDSCLQEHELPTSLRLSNFRLTMAKAFQPTLLLIIREHILHSAKCGYVLATRGRFQEAADHLSMVKDSLLQLLGGEHEKSMAAMLGLAGVLWGLGRLEEAITLQRQVVDTRTQLYGPQHEQTLQAMDQLGKSHWLHGQYQEALEIQEATVQRAKATLGEKHTLTLAALDNLGVTLASWHKYEESAQAHREVLTARQHSLGDTHLDTLTTMSNLAMAMLDLGDLDKASALMSSVHYQRQQQLGKEHPWTLWALCYLAKVYVKQGHLQEAEAMLVWGVEAGERSLSKAHLGVLMGRGELARVYSRQGRTTEAEELLVDTARLLEASRGLAHPDCVFVRLKLADLYVVQGNREKAMENCRLGLQRADLRITRSHPLGQRLESLLKSLQETPS
jgi:tetratricopeptide (TPR) repeat protein